MSGEAKIRVEIDTDPESIGYDGKTDVEVSVLMNDQTLDTADRKGVPSNAVIEATISGYAALSAADRNLYSLLVTREEVDMSFGNVRNAFGTLFAAGSTERDALIALQTRPASRGQKIGVGRVREGDVTRARALP